MADLPLRLQLAQSGPKVDPQNGSRYDRNEGKRPFNLQLIEQCLSDRFNVFGQYPDHAVADSGSGASRLWCPWDGQLVPMQYGVILYSQPKSLKF